MLLTLTQLLFSVFKERVAIQIAITTDSNYRQALEHVYI